MSPRVVIVGAGILGLSTAHALVERGVRSITIVEATVPGAGATGRSGALVRANYDNAVEARLALHALEYWRAFGDRVGGTCGFQDVGLLVAVPPDESEAAAALAEAQRGWGVAIGALDREAARTLAPRLRTDDLGLVLHHPDAGCCDAGLTVAAYVARLARDGVELRFGLPALALAGAGDRVVGVETREGLVPGDAVVLAAGVWTNGLLPPGCDLGLVPQLTRVATFRPHEFEAAPIPTILDRAQEAWFRPMPNGAVLVGSESGVVPGIDPDAVPWSAPDELVARYGRILARRFDVSPHAPPRGAWAGAFMLSPDHRPIVGAMPGYEGLYLAAGDSGGAFKTAPALGLGLAETILDGEATSVDIAALGPERLLARPSAADRPRAATVSR